MKFNECTPDQHEYLRSILVDVLGNVKNIDAAWDEQIFSLKDETICTALAMKLLESVELFFVHDADQQSGVDIMNLLWEILLHSDNSKYVVLQYLF
jgi:hypothetical protein